MMDQGLSLKLVIRISIVDLVTLLKTMQSYWGDYLFGQQGMTVHLILEVYSDLWTRASVRLLLTC